MAVDRAYVTETLRQGVAQHQRGHLQEAKVCYLEVLRSDPDNTEALHLLGTVEGQTGHLNTAERVLRRALSLRPDCGPYCNTLGTVLKRKGADTEALEWFTRACELDPRLAEAWHSRGRILKRLGRLDEAEASLREAGRLRPDSARILNDLGTVYEMLGRHDQAAQQFEHAIRARPGYAYAHNNLGAVYLGEGRLAQAARCFENALHHAPDMASAMDNLGLVHLERGAPELALPLHERALELAPSLASAHAHRAAALQALGRLDEAEEGFRQALSIAPEHAGAIAGLAELAEWRGEYQRGLEIVESRASASDAPAGLRLACARLLSRVYRLPEALELLEPLTEEEPDPGTALSASQRRRLHFTLGELYDSGGHYERAFEHYRQGNQLRSSNFDGEAWRAQVDAILVAFSGDAMECLPRAEQPGSDLILIVGMPRSGTSLVEQILARHPRVRASGELGSLGALAQGLAERLKSPEPYPQCLHRLRQRDLNDMTEAYRLALGERERGVAFVTDKMPLNFLHLGLAALLFPRARVVNCERDPLDNALSCYFQDFADPALDFSASLTGIATFYHGYRRLMAHWKAVSGLRILDLGYERLVGETEANTRRLLDFLGLEWDEACLKFYESGRAVHTASHAQVRRPIYRSSVGRHRNYAAFMETLRGALGDTGDST